MSNSSGDIVSIVDSRSGTSALILPGVGFNCFRFSPVVEGIPRDVIWSEPHFGPQSPLALNGIPLLFPFAGRLQGDSFSFEGRTYHLAGAISDGVNVIHGFVIARPWRIVDQSADSITGEFQASVDDPSLLDQWPTDFCIRVSYRVHETSLISDILVENPGNRTLPFGFGTHPYFRIQSANSVVSDPIISVPANDEWTHSGSLPTGKRVAVDGANDLRSGVAFSELAFDGVLTDIQEEEDGLAHTTIDDRATGLRIEQTFSPVFRNCVIYTPIHREAVAIEPWSCLPNAFALNAKGIETGLDLLPPGESWATRIVITASSLS